MCRSRCWAPRARSRFPLCSRIKTGRLAAAGAHTGASNERGERALDQRRPSIEETICALESCSRSFAGRPSRLRCRRFHGHKTTHRAHRLNSSDTVRPARQRSQRHRLRSPLSGARDAHGVLGRDVRVRPTKTWGASSDVIVDRAGLVRAAVIGFRRLSRRRQPKNSGPTGNALHFGRIATRATASRSN